MSQENVAGSASRSASLAALGVRSRRYWYGRWVGAASPAQGREGTTCVTGSI